MAALGRPRQGEDPLLRPRRRQPRRPARDDRARRPSAHSLPPTAAAKVPRPPAVATVAMDLSPPKRIGAAPAAAATRPPVGAVRGGGGGRESCGAWTAIEADHSDMRHVGHGEEGTATASRSFCLSQSPRPCRFKTKCNRKDCPFLPPKPHALRPAASQRARCSAGRRRSRSAPRPRAMCAAAKPGASRAALALACFRSDCWYRLARAHGRCLRGALLPTACRGPRLAAAAVCRFRHDGDVGGPPPSSAAAAASSSPTSRTRWRCGGRSASGTVAGRPGSGAGPGRCWGTTEALPRALARLRGMLKNPRCARSCSATCRAAGSRCAGCHRTT